MIINMAKVFNMSSIVEGVETQSELELIKSIGADQYQGFLFSKAIERAIGGLTYLYVEPRISKEKAKNILEGLENDKS